MILIKLLTLNQQHYCVTEWQITVRREKNQIILESQRTVEAFTIQDAIDYSAFGILQAKASSDVEIPPEVQDEVFEKAKETRKPEYPRLNFD